MSAQIVKQASLGDADDFIQLVLHGLSQPQKMIPSLFLYDERGSELFEQITHLEEYYPTRTEIALLERYAKDIASTISPGATIVEFGSGSSRKTPLLLNQLEFPKNYVPVDISRDFLFDAAKKLANDMPHINVIPVHGDFTQPFDMPAKAQTGCHVGFFPGSTLGNFTRPEAQKFLQNAKQSLGQRAIFIAGVDLKKSENILVPAYDDAQGVTAAFNLNLLNHLNETMSGDFDLDAYAHEARFNTEFSRIEMHLRALSDQTITLAGHNFEIADGETIHTENSYKYSLDEFNQLAHQSGWQPLINWTDERELFSLNMLLAKESV